MSQKALYKKFIEIITKSANLPSDYINILEPEFSEFSTNNGEGWRRFDGDFGKKYKVITVAINKQFRISYQDYDIEEFNQITAEVEKLDFSKPKHIKSSNTVKYIKVVGEKMKCIITRAIRADIREHFKNDRCVVCGASDTEIDHKNGLYDDTRVLTLKTQKITDFQVLCKHCNDIKRQSVVKTKETNLRQVPPSSVRIFGIDFTEGNEEFKGTLVGTYWYDPVKFMECIKTNLIMSEFKNLKI